MQLWLVWKCGVWTCRLGAVELASAMALCWIGRAYGEAVVSDTAYRDRERLYACEAHGSEMAGSIV